MSKKKQDEAMGIEPSKVDLMKHERYASALRRFNKLTWAKNEFAEKKQKLVIQCARVGEDARQYVARESRCLPSLTTDEINAQAKILESGEDALDRAIELRRDAGIHPPAFRERSDVAVVNELDELRAALSLIEGVLPGLGKEVARYRAAAIAEAVEQVRPGYERVALRIAAALTGLANAVEEEKRFIQPLLEKDRDFANALLPRPLSQAGIFETPELLSWMATAKRLGLLNQQQALALAVPEEAAAVAIN
jgi:hypothetical protein